VKDDVRDKLIRYRRECSRVLLLGSAADPTAPERFESVNQDAILNNEAAAAHGAAG
jgi:hypothetical protein